MPSTKLRRSQGERPEDKSGAVVSTYMKTIDEVVRRLPPDLQEEVRDFACFLLKAKVAARRRRLKMGWAGALRAFRRQFTSLELQRKALEWWGD
jgi:hypothetical protein